MLSERKYMLADVAGKLNVPSYRLRHLEDVLALNIPKDNRGLRYYTKHEIELISDVLYLEKRGFTLSELRLVLNDIPRIKKLPPERLVELKERLDACSGASEVTGGDEYNQSTGGKTGKELAATSNKLATSPDDKMLQFKNLMTEIVLEALNINNDKLATQINYGVSEMVTREIGCMISKKEEADEERFKRVDRMLREAVAGK